jgi:hypothetical protein
MQALDLGIEICWPISRPLLAFAKAYILLQKEYIYTRNHDKLFSKAEFFTCDFEIFFLSFNIGDNLQI